MYRTIKPKIIELLKNEKHALLIDGARQVGKTYIIREVLKEMNTPYLEINLAENKTQLEVIKSAADIKSLVNLFNTFSLVPLIKGKSFIFIDEVQLYPELITLIKGLVDEGSYHYVLSGSLFGVTYKKISFYPVGYLNILTMYPMTFKEFLIVNGIKKENMDYLKLCYKNKEIVNDYLHRKLLELFRIYLIVGGMPSIVNMYISGSNLVQIQYQQRSIMEAYKVDFSQYGDLNNQMKVLKIYNNLVSQLSKQDTKYIFTDLDKNFKFARYENSFNWLNDSGVTIPIYIANNLKLPLEITRDTNVFKLFFNDVGLFTSAFSFDTREQLLNPANELNNGPLFENYVAEELLGYGIKPYYYKNRKLGGLDFVIEKESKILPIEVKSGRDYKTHRSLDNYLRREEFNLDNAIVFSQANVLKEGKITYYPIYMTMFLKEEEKEVILNRVTGI